MVSRDVVARSGTARGEVLLLRRTTDDTAAVGVLELRVNGVFVMDTLNVSSEQVLAQHALTAAAHLHRVLVGGLGLGFTVQALLTDARVERLVVLEIEPDVVRWVQDGLVPETADVLDDPRVEVRVQDVAAYLTQCEPASFDAVLLDVDNGPGQLVYERNAGLYTREALARGLSRCTSEGALVLWSAEHSPALVQRLRRTGTSVHHEPVAVTLQGRETHYHLYVAHPPRR